MYSNINIPLDEGYYFYIEENTTTRNTTSTRNIAPKDFIKLIFIKFLPLSKQCILLQLLLL